jgi:hypothetical protein
MIMASYRLSRVGNPEEVTLMEVKEGTESFPEEEEGVQEIRAPVMEKTTCKETNVIRVPLICINLM